MTVSGFPIPALPMFPTPVGNILWVDAAGGSDSWPGTQVQPKQTIQAAVNASVTGTTIMIAPTGVYHEEVTTTLKYNLTLRTSHPSHRPIIDGGGVNVRGILHNSTYSPNVYGLEIRNVKYAGIQVAGPAVVWGNVIHAIGEKGTPTVDANIQGIKFNGGSGGQIKQNFIYNVGFAGEARGILCLNTNSCLVEQNVIYNARKEGIRVNSALPVGYTGNIVRNNIFAMCWVGMAGNADFGTQWLNNLVLDCQQGVNNKHHYSGGEMAFPGLTPPQPASVDPTLAGWSRTHHNTFVRCSTAAIWPCVNLPYGDFYSYQDNLMVDAGEQYLWEFPDVNIRGPNLVFNNNVYVTSGSGIRLPQRLALMKGYQNTGALSSQAATLTALKAWANTDFGPEWPGVTGLAPYETNGQEKSVTQVAFNDLAAGDADYSGTVVGVDLGDGYGTQVGARGLTPPSIRWTQIQAVAASANFNTTTAIRSTNDLSDDYYYVGSPRSSGVNLTYDFGAPVTFTYFKLMPFGHQQGYNPHTFDLQTSADGTTWATVQSIVLGDYEGSTFYYNLDEVVTARYVRLLDVRSFEYPATGAPTGIVLSDFLVGTVTLAGDTSTYLIDGYTPPPPDEDPPTDPSVLVASNVTYVGFDVTWTASIDDVAVDHYVYRVTGGLETGDPVTTTSTGFSFVTTDVDAETYTVFVKSVDTSANESDEISLDVDKPGIPTPSVATAYWGMRA